MKKIEKIEVLGSGCPSCKNLYELVKKAVESLGLKIEVNYVTDIQKIIALGVMSSPVMTINSQVVLAGQVPDLEKLKEIIAGETQDKAEKKTCSCSGKC